MFKNLLLKESTLSESEIIEADKLIFTATHNFLRTKKPFLFHILQSLSLYKDFPGIDTMAVDGAQNIYINRRFALYELKTMEMVAGVLAHEVLHILNSTIPRQHTRTQKYGPYSLWNIVTDFVMNKDLLQDGFKLPAMGMIPIMCADGWCIDLEKTFNIPGTLTISNKRCEQVYDELLEILKNSNAAQPKPDKDSESGEGEGDEGEDESEGGGESEGEDDGEGEDRLLKKGDKVTSLDGKRQGTVLDARGAIKGQQTLTIDWDDAPLSETSITRLYLPILESVQSNVPCRDVMLKDKQSGKNLKNDVLTPEKKKQGQAQGQAQGQGKDKAQGQAQGQGPGLGQENSRGSSPGGWDQHIRGDATKGGANNSKALSENERVMIQNRIQQSVESARRKGFDIGNYLEPDAVPIHSWQDILRKYLENARKIRDWSQPKPYNLSYGHYKPVKKTVRGGKIRAVIAIDTSGSIGKEEVTAVMTELKEICTINHELELRIMFWHTGVYLDEVVEGGSEEVFDEIANLPMQSGGTMISSVAAALGNESDYYNVVIYFTDGYVEPDPVFPEDVDSIIILNHSGGDGIVDNLTRKLNGRGEVYKTDF